MIYFYAPASVSDNIAKNTRLIMIGNLYEWIRFWLGLKYYAGICLQGLRQKHSHYSWHPERDFNP
jgi:hypothetical protein